MENKIRTFRNFVGTTALLFSFSGGGAHSEEIAGIVEQIDINGQIHVDGDLTVVQWGLKIDDLEQINALLRGRLIRCDTLEENEGVILADCRLSPNVSQPDTLSEYLDLFSWLPIFGFSRKSCSVTDFEDSYSFWKQGTGNLSYGCRANQPVRSTLQR